MARSIRPIATFVLRLWREPGDQEGDAGWRGLIRLLDAGEAGAYFQGLDHLPVVLRQVLAREGAPASQQVEPTGPVLDDSET